MELAEQLTAEVLVATNGDLDVLRQVIDSLDHEIKTRPLDRVVRRWDISVAQLGTMFGVSRQAAAKWLADGPPAARHPQIAFLDESTEILNRWIKRERIPAVVRRPVDAFGGRSRLDVALDGSFEMLRNEIVDTFDLARIAP